MKKLFTIIIISLIVTACKKDKPTATPIDEIVEIHFTLDGKEYSKVLEKNEINSTGGFGIPDAQGNYNQTQSVSFELDSILEIQIELGFYHRKNNDVIDNLSDNIQILKQFLQSGIAYKSLQYDSSIKNAVAVSLSARNTDHWRSYKTDWINYKPILITNEQDGSHFTITEIKEVSTDGQRNNAFIIKGSFNCNVYDERTGSKKVLTDGTFTCILLA